MNPDEQRIAIAESVGWSDISQRMKWGVPPNVEDDGTEDCLKVIPNYLDDLNAMHKAEKSLTAVQFGVCYIEHLKTAMGESEYSIEHSIVRATAAQRAAAYLKTIGKWEVTP